MKPSSSRRRRKAGLASTVVLAAGTLTVVPLIAAAVHPAQGVFALDGYVIDQGGDPPYDWDDVFTEPADPDDDPSEKALPPGGISSDFQRDFLTSGSDTTSGADLTYVNGDETYYATGSKDTLDIPGWQCKKTNNATDKGDYVNAYGFAANVAVGGSDHIVFFFGLEKDDDNGTNNIGVWLLQDESVACVSTSGKAVDFTGAHEDGDLLAVVEYDSGGTVGTARGYLWKDPDGPGGTAGSLDSTPAFTVDQAKCGSAQTNSSEFCIITNADGTRTTPWWSPQKADKSATAVLQKNVFVEGFLDITNVFGAGDEPCFAGALADTRASTSLTAALYDYVGIQAPTCGPLVVRKYLDKAADKLAGSQAFGDADNPAGAGWTIKVFANGADPTTQPLYQGTTGTDGTVSFDDVPFGEYDVYEGLKDGNWYNTDPGSAVPIKQDVTKGTGTTTVTFGNACYVDKTFQVTNVPTGVNLSLRYTINNQAGSTQTVAMQTSNGTASYTLTDTLKVGDEVDWAYGLSGTFITGEDNEVIAAGDYTFNVDGSCTMTNTAAFPYATVTGMKYKDADADGDESDNDAGLGGFEFRLYAGSSGASGTALATATSADGSGGTTLGRYTFTNVPPGTYSVVETPRSGWQQTAPVSPTFRTVTVSLGDASASVGRFLNTPLTDVDVTVTPQTTSSEATINCFTGSQAGPRIGTLDSTPGGTPTAPKTRSVDDLTVGTYVCVVVITDP
jgi:hypothetical protein